MTVWGDGQRRRTGTTLTTMSAIAQSSSNASGRRTRATTWPLARYMHPSASAPGQQQTISAVARQVCSQPHSGSQYASFASASRFTASDSPPE